MFVFFVLFSENSLNMMMMMMMTPH